MQNWGHNECVNGFIGDSAIFALLSSQNDVNLQYIGYTYTFHGFQKKEIKEKGEHSAKFTLSSFKLII